MKSHYLTIALAMAVAYGTPALAADDASCQKILLSDPGWTDINATNGVATVLLEALGYDPDVKTLSVPIGYQSMKNGDIDVFLGNWMPAQQKFMDDLKEANAVDVLTRNLTGAKFTLAVPSYVAAAGVKDFKDLAANADKFDSEIYGIEPGAPANSNIQKMIDANDFELGDWSVVESGEQAMLAQVARNESDEKWIVFLAWAPHPMNSRFDIEYLSGGDDYFGPDYGGAEVYTLARTGWAEKCPNAAQLFKNLVFELSMENELMGKILDDGQEPDAAAKAWLKNHPDVVGPWLENVTTFEGEPAEPAVKDALGL